MTFLPGSCLCLCLRDLLLPFFIFFPYLAFFTPTHLEEKFSQLLQELGKLRKDAYYTQALSQLLQTAGGECLQWVGRDERIIDYS
jgi:hypothetical protein